MISYRTLILLSATLAAGLNPECHAAPVFGGRHGTTAADGLEASGFAITEEGLSEAMTQGNALRAMEVAFYHDIDIEEEAQAYIAARWPDGEIPETSLFLPDLIALRYLAGRGDALSLQRMKDIASLDRAPMKERVQAAEFVAEVSSDYSHVAVLEDALDEGEFAFVAHALQEYPAAEAQNLNAWIATVDHVLDRVAAEGQDLEMGTRAGLERLVNAALALDTLPRPLYDKFVELAGTENDFVALVLPQWVLDESANAVPPPQQ